MKVLRSSLVAAVAIFAAACGDKVTVAGPPTTDTTPKVNSVAVAPATATMSIGQSVSFTAVVDVSNGAATTVTWSSSDASKVSVTAAGVASAVASTPGVAICATSTVDASKKGCASVAVTAATQVIPATVQIQSVTTGAAGQPSIPAAGAAGLIDVRLNVAPGNQTVSKVVLVVGGVRIDSQVFTAAQSAALRYAADEAAANQATFPLIVFQINTAAYNTTTGVPTFTNGPKTISAQLFTTGSTTAATATAQTSVLFTNVDGWHATVSTSGTTANGLNTGGFRYDRGGVAVSAVPVSYTGAAVASGTVTFGSAACDASGIGARTVALVAPAAGSSAWTATIAQTGTAGAGNANAYEFNGGIGGCTLNAVGETPTVTAVNAAGDALFTAAAPINTGAVTGMRLDNRAPVVPAGANNAGTGLIRINLNPNGRANGWINDAVTLGTGATTATSNGFLCGSSAAGFGATCIALDTLPRDNGVGGATYYTKIGATKTAATTATGLTSAATVAASATNTSYCAIAYAADALGNETASPSTTTACGAEVNSTTIGVDRAAPTIAYSGGIAANARLSGGTVGAEFSVTVNDTGLVGNSGMLPTSPVLMSLSRRAIGAANSAGTTTLRNANNTATITALSATGVTAAAPIYTTTFTGTTGAANHAYWTHNATAFDAAGNSASVTPRVMVYDAAAPVPGAPSAAVTLTATNYSANAFISEDLDIQDFSFGVTFGALGPFTSAAAQLQMPVVAVNGFNAATFANTNYGVSATVPLPLALQANVGAGLTNMAGLYTTARSQSNLAATSGNFVPGVVTPGTAIPLTNFTTFPAVTGAPAATMGGGAGTGIVTGNTTAASATSTGPLQTNVTLTATITGTTAVFNNPFSRIDFYMKDATGTRYFNVGSATVASLNDNGATRTFTFTATINGPTVYGLLGGAGATFASDIVAVGIGAANANIGMVSAAVAVINVVF